MATLREPYFGTAALTIDNDIPKRSPIYPWPKLGADNAIKADTGFGSLNGQFPMDIRRNPDHELSAIMFACDRFRNGFAIDAHV